MNTKNQRKETALEGMEPANQNAIDAICDRQWNHTHRHRRAKALQNGRSDGLSNKGNGAPGPDRGNLVLTIAKRHTPKPS